MTARPFKVGDRATVSNHILTKEKARARVICVNRKSKYGEIIVALVDRGDQELFETFKEDGTKYLPGNACRLTLGWSEE